MFICSFSCFSKSLNSNNVKTLGERKLLSKLKVKLAFFPNTEPEKAQVTDNIDISQRPKNE